MSNLDVELYQPLLSPSENSEPIENHSQATDSRSFPNHGNSSFPVQPPPSFLEATSIQTSPIIQQGTWLVGWNSSILMPSFPNSVQQPIMRPPPNDVLAMSILTCLCCFCCGGLLPLVLAILSRNDRKLGPPGSGQPDMLSALILNRVAWATVICSLITGVCTLTLYAISFVFISEYNNV